MANIEKIGNISFEHEFPDVNNTVKKVVIDPLYVMEYIKTMIPELFNLAPETRDSIRATASEDAKANIAESDGEFTIFDAIVCRMFTSQRYPVAYAPPFKVFYDTIREALGATQMTSIMELWTALFACIRAIGNLASVKKNIQDCQDSPDSTQESGSTLQLSPMKPSTVCGSISPDSSPQSPLSA